MSAKRGEIVVDVSTTGADVAMAQLTALKNILTEIVSIMDQAVDRFERLQTAFASLPDKLQKQITGVKK